MGGNLHNLVCYSPTGQYLDTLTDFMRLECTLSEMTIGTLLIDMPPTHDPAIYQRDGRIAFYRAPATDNLISPRLVGNTTWLIGRRQLLVAQDNAQIVRLTCVHPNVLLGRRVVAYNETSAEAKKTAPADNMIKAVVRENFVSAIDVTRNWDSTLFAVEADTTASAVTDKEFSYRTVLGVLQEIAAAASATGEYTGFEVYSPSETGPYTLRTYVGQRGTNRSSGSGQALTLGVAYGSMGDTELDENWMEMISFVYASGSGKKNERVVDLTIDSALVAATPYGRIEWLQNVTQTADTAVLAAEGFRALRERRPRELFTGAVIDTEYATFGEEYDWGDRVVGEFSAPIVFQGFSSGRMVRQFDCRVDPVKITVERAENRETGVIEETESLDIRLRGEAVLT